MELVSLIISVFAGVVFLTLRNCQSGRSLSLLSIMVQFTNLLSGTERCSLQVQKRLEIGF